MDRIADKHREELLLRIIRDIDSGELEGTRFGAGEWRTGGGHGLILYNYRGSKQLQYEGYLHADLEALARTGVLEVSWNGNSLDVVVMPAARSYKSELTIPVWKRGLRATRGLGQPAKYVTLILIGAVLNQFANSVVWPWLTSIVGSR